MPEQTQTTGHYMAQVSDEQIQEYRTVFDVFDRDKNGTICAAEIYGAMKQLGRDPTHAQVEQMLRELDINGDGAVDFNEFVILLDKEADLEGISGLLKQSQQQHKNINPTTKTTTTESQPQTKAEPGESAADEVKRRRELAKEREGREMFRSFDQDGDGHVDADELAEVMSGIGERLKDDEIERMIKEADIDGDGRVNFEEFRKMTGQ